jgi:hypothetical protein
MLVMVGWLVGYNDITDILSGFSYLIVGCANIKVVGAEKICVTSTDQLQAPPARDMSNVIKGID